jgi:hypothetical protein
METPQPGYSRRFLRWLPRRFATAGMNSAVGYTEVARPRASARDKTSSRRLAYGLLILTMGVAFVRLMTHQQSPHLPV